VRRRGASPEFLTFGGIFWLVAVPAFGLIWMAILWPMRMFGDCFHAACSTKGDALPYELIPPAVGLFAILVVLLGLLQVARRRPQVGFPIFGAIGVVILLSVCAGVAISGQPVLLLLLAAWPGWSGIAFTNAAWRAGKLGKVGAGTSPTPDERGIPIGL
jgi:hypothetical protein